MPQTNRDREALRHMIEAGEAILVYAKGGKQRFLANEMAQDAIVRRFEIMGEAAKRLSPTLREANRQVPWRSITAFRDRLIHGYDIVEPERVWAAVGGPLKDALPLLRKLLT